MPPKTCRTVKAKPPLGHLDIPEQLASVIASDPNVYGLIIQGDCMVPDADDGDFVVCSPAAEVKVGGLIAVEFKNGNRALKRLVQAIPRGMLPQFEHPQSEVTAQVLVEQINPPKRFSSRADELVCIHAVVGVVRKADAVRR